MRCTRVSQDQRVTMISQRKLDVVVPGTCGAAEVPAAIWVALRHCGSSARIGMRCKPGNTLRFFGATRMVARSATARRDRRTQHVLPPTPYTSSSGYLVRSTRTLWFRQSDQLIACTLDERATDTCSVETTEFDRSASGWIKVSGNAVLCNVATKHGGT
jgi:hypothetical protein